MACRLSPQFLFWEGRKAGSHYTIEGGGGGKTDGKGNDNFVLRDMGRRAVKKKIWLKRRGTRELTGGKRRSV